MVNGVRIIELIVKVITTILMVYVGVSTIIIAVTLASIIRPIQDKDVLDLVRINLTLGVLSSYFGLIIWFFDSYIDISRIFIRLHNLIVLWILFVQLNKALNKHHLSIYSEETFKDHFKMTDLFDQDEIDDIQKSSTRAGLALIIITILNVIMTLVFIWKIVKFYIFYYLEIDV